MINRARNANEIKKTKAQLVNELAKARRRIAELEASEAEHKQAKKALHRSELLYRTTIEAIDSPLHVVDSDLRIALGNTTFARWCQELGLEADAIGKTLFQIFPFLSEKIGEEYRQVFDTGEALVTESRTIVGDREYITEARKMPLVGIKEILTKARRRRYGILSLLGGNLT